MVKHRRALPADIEEFVQLMRKHGDLRITYANACKHGGCERGVQKFQRQYFAGRSQVRLRELIPFVRSYTIFWGDLLFIVEEVLIAQGILDPNFDYQETIDRPAVWLKRSQ